MHRLAAKLILAEHGADDESEFASLISEVLRLVNLGPPSPDAAASAADLSAAEKKAAVFFCVWARGRAPGEVSP